MFEMVWLGLVEDDYLSPFKIYFDAVKSKVDLVNVLGAVHKLRHLFSDLSRPLPSPLSSCVIFWPTPPTPQPDDVIYEWVNAISMKDYFLRSPGWDNIFHFLARFCSPPKLYPSVNFDNSLKD